MAVSGFNYFSLADQQVQLSYFPSAFFEMQLRLENKTNRRNLVFNATGINFGLAYST
jgi:hypothetical protein